MSSEGDPDPDGDEPRSPTRRRVLIGSGVAGALLVAGGAGVLGGFLEPRDVRLVPRRPPDLLLAAARAEQLLIDAVTTAARTDPAHRDLLGRFRSDHEAHHAALAALLARYDPPSAAQRAALTRQRPASGGGVGELEAAAAVAAAGRARRLSGATAAMVASIAACEAVHAELLR